MKKTIKIILMLIIGGVFAASAQTPAIISSDKTGWHKIGETTVDFKKDRDEVAILGANRFASIKFKVIDAPIDLQNLEIFYESGDIQKVDVRTPIKPHSESRVIDLNGKESNLSKVVFVYKTLPNTKDEKAHVEIWGLKTNTVVNSEAENPQGRDNSIVLSDSKGWHKIGERPVDFVKDHDEFVVIGADRFSAIKFKVTEASIQLINLSVSFESGDMQKIPVNSDILIGTESSVIQLNGGERALKKIVFEYKTLPNQTAQRAIVEVWGLKTNMAVK